MLSGSVPSFFPCHSFCRRSTPRRGSFTRSGFGRDCRKEQLALAALFGLLAATITLAGSFIFGIHHIQFAFAGQLALAMSSSVLVVSSLSPMIEYMADNLPDRTYGYVGVFLFMMGFVIQAIPSLLVLLAAPH